MGLSWMKFDAFLVRIDKISFEFLSKKTNHLVKVRKLFKIDCLKKKQLNKIQLSIHQLLREFPNLDMKHFWLRKTFMKIQLVHLLSSIRNWNLNLRLKTNKLLKQSNEFDQTQVTQDLKFEFMQHLNSERRKCKQKLINYVWRIRIWWLGWLGRRWESTKWMGWES